MRRTEALKQLSRDHHQALVVAQQLRRATAETGAAARERFLAYWTSHGALHFRAEEEVLLPAYAGHGDPGHPLVARVLVDHVDIRHRAQELEQRSETSPEMLRFDDWGDTTLHVKLALVAVVAGLVVWHMRRPALRALDGAIFLGSLALVWLGVALAHT